MRNLERKRKLKIRYESMRRRKTKRKNPCEQSSDNEIDFDIFCLNHFLFVSFFGILHKHTLMKRSDVKTFSLLFKKKT